LLGPPLVKKKKRPISNAQAKTSRKRQVKRNPEEEQEERNTWRKNTSGGRGEKDFFQYRTNRNTTCPTSRWNSNRCKEFAKSLKNPQKRDEKQTKTWEKKNNSFPTHKRKDGEKKYTQGRM